MCYNKNIKSREWLILLTNKQKLTIEKFKKLYKSYLGKFNIKLSTEEFDAIVYVESCEIANLLIDGHVISFDNSKNITIPDHSKSLINDIYKYYRCKEGLLSAFTRAVELADLVIDIVMDRDALYGQDKRLCRLFKNDRNFYLKLYKVPEFKTLMDTNDYILNFLVDVPEFIGYTIFYGSTFLNELPELWKVHNKDISLSKPSVLRAYKCIDIVEKPSDYVNINNLYSIFCK